MSGRRTRENEALKMLHRAFRIFLTTTCGGQNRNYNVARYSVYAANTVKNVSSIEINFMESGHSFLPNDSDFSNISDAMKSRSTIYTIDEYVSLIEKCTGWLESSKHLTNSMRF